MRRLQKLKPRHVQRREEHLETRHRHPIRRAIQPSEVFALVGGRRRVISPADLAQAMAQRRMRTTLRPPRED